MQRREFIQAAATVAVVGLPARADTYHFPVERGPFRPTDMVDLQHLEPTLKLDIRYATAQNFMHRALYPSARAFMQRPAAEAVVRVHRRLRQDGFGLVIFDAYRPWSVTRDMAVASPPEWVGKFLADPNQGSRHNRGCAVDLSLVHLETGAEVVMPTDFDNFTERAHTHDTQCSPEAASHRSALQAAMQAEGFSLIESEWWHFDYKDWQHYAVLDTPFSQLEH
jgi:D-alanyl-D-alanine dipeptidase